MQESEARASAGRQMMGSRALRAGAELLDEWSVSALESDSSSRETSRRDSARGIGWDTGVRADSSAASGHAEQHLRW